MHQHEDKSNPSKNRHDDGVPVSVKLEPRDGFDDGDEVGACTSSSRNEGHNSNLVELNDVVLVPVRSVDSRDQPDDVAALQSQAGCCQLNSCKVEVDESDEVTENSADSSKMSAGAGTRELPMVPTEERRGSFFNMVSEEYHGDCAADRNFKLECERKSSRSVMQEDSRTDFELNNISSDIDVMKLSESRNLNCFRNQGSNSVTVKVEATTGTDYQQSCFTNPDFVKSEQIAQEGVSCSNDRNLVMDNHTAENNNAPLSKPLRDNNTLADQLIAGASILKRLRIQKYCQNFANIAKIFGNPSDSENEESLHATDMIADAEYEEISYARVYQCSYCDRKFSTMKNLMGHERIHVGDKPYECSQCPKKFSQNKHLKAHEKTHLAEKPFKCVHCDKTFCENQSLALHERTHTGEKPYVCVHCGKTFSQVGNLRRHERVHTGEKPFQCSFCSKKFADPSTLQRHERAHRGDKMECLKKFTCSTCGKKFANNCALQEHERTHTGEKPFVCSYCHKAFSKTGNLKRHEVIHASQEERQS